MKFPLFIYIKPPDDSILQKIVPTVWWESQHKMADEKAKKAYYASCATLQRHVQELEALQVCSPSVVFLFKKSETFAEFYFSG